MRRHRRTRPSAVAVVVGSEHRDGRAGLGEAVGVDEADLGQQSECLAHQGKSDLRAAVGQVPQGRQRDRLRLKRRHDAIEHGRHDGRGRDALVAHQPDPLARLELPQVDHLSARVQVRQRRADARDVIRRHADQRGVTGVRGVELDRPGDVAGQVVVRQLNGFRPRGGARGEQHHRRRRPDRRTRLRARRCAQPSMNSSEVMTCLPAPATDIAVFGVGDHQRSRQAVDQLRAGRPRSAGSSAA